MLNEAADCETLEDRILHLTAHVRMHPDRPGMHLRLAKLQSEAGRQADAQATVRDMLRRFPEIRYALLRQTAPDAPAPRHPGVKAKVAETYVLAAAHLDLAERALRMAREPVAPPAPGPHAAPGASPAGAATSAHADTRVYPRAAPTPAGLPDDSFITELLRPSARAEADEPPGRSLVARRWAGWVLAHRAEAVLAGFVAVMLLCGALSATRHTGGILLNRRVWAEVAADGS